MMNIIEVDYFSMIAFGEFGTIKIGTPLIEVHTLLGEPFDYAPSSEGTHLIESYGNLQITFNNETVALITLILNLNEFLLPPRILLLNFEEPQLDIEEVEEILKQRNVNWKYIDILSNEWVDYYRSSAGVHFSFNENVLSKISIADPKEWIF